MNHIVRNSTLCGDDWCDAKREIAALKNTLAIHDKLFDERDAKIALLREALEKIKNHSTDDAAHTAWEALEATK